MTPALAGERSKRAAILSGARSLQRILLAAATHGVPVRWQTRIETWEPPLRFVDTQRKGPYSLWEHTHLFEKDGETATIIHDRVRYAIPLGPLGALAHLLFVRRDLRRIFDYRREAVSERLVLG